MTLTASNANTNNNTNSSSNNNTPVSGTAGAEFVTPLMPSTTDLASNSPATSAVAAVAAATLATPAHSIDYASPLTDEVLSALPSLTHVTPLSLFPTPARPTSGRQVAANQHLICYTIANNRVRLLDQKYASRALLPKHKHNIVDIGMAELSSSTATTATPATPATATASATASAATTSSQHVMYTIDTSGNKAFWKITLSSLDSTAQSATGSTIFQIDQVAFPPRSEVAKIAANQSSLVLLIPNNNEVSVNPSVNAAIIDQDTVSLVRFDNDGPSIVNSRSWAAPSFAAPSNTATGGPVAIASTMTSSIVAAAYPDGSIVIDEPAKGVNTARFAHIKFNAGGALPSQVNYLALAECAGKDDSVIVLLGWRSNTRLSVLHVQLGSRNAEAKVKEIEHLILSPASDDEAKNGDEDGGPCIYIEFDPFSAMLLLSGHQRRTLGVLKLNTVESELLGNSASAFTKAFEFQLGETAIISAITADPTVARKSLVATAVDLSNVSACLSSMYAVKSKSIEHLAVYAGDLSREPAVRQFVSAPDAFTSSSPFFTLATATVPPQQQQSPASVAPAKSSEAAEPALPAQSTPANLSASVAHQAVEPAKSPATSVNAFANEIPSSTPKPPSNLTSPAGKQPTAVPPSVSTASAPAAASIDTAEIAKALEKGLVGRVTKTIQDHLKRSNSALDTANNRLMAHCDQNTTTVITSVRQVEAALPIATGVAIAQSIDQAMANLVLPTIDSTISTNIPRILTSDKFHGTARAAIEIATRSTIESYIKSSSFSDVITGAITPIVRSEVQTAVREEVGKTLVPAYERATAAMFEQMQVAFNEKMEAMQRSVFDSLMTAQKQHLDALQAAIPHPHPHPHPPPPAPPAAAPEPQWMPPPPPPPPPHVVDSAPATFGASTTNVGSQASMSILSSGSPRPQPPASSAAGSAAQFAGFMGVAHHAPPPSGVQPPQDVRDSFLRLLTPSRPTAMSSLGMFGRTAAPQVPPPTGMTPLNLPFMPQPHGQTPAHPPPPPPPAFNLSHPQVAASAGAPHETTEPFVEPAPAAAAAPPPAPAPLPEPPLALMAEANSLAASGRFQKAFETVLNCENPSAAIAALCAGIEPRRLVVGEVQMEESILVKALSALMDGLSGSDERTLDRLVWLDVIMVKLRRGGIFSALDADEDIGLPAALQQLLAKLGQLEKVDKIKKDLRIVAKIGKVRQSANEFL
ncbi:hypothetical protein GQ42DRAFT_31260 [Ramicandelaber brevisporus]|nr:hypothetical protein GQ42DRAFT_31260 [Ramicandelaber brevisporus]